MPLINVVVTLIVVGVLLWLVNTYIPMDGKIKNILNIVKEFGMDFYDESSEPDYRRIFGTPALKV